MSPEGLLGKQPPPRPDYSLKGRTVASLLRQVEEWHKELGQDRDRPSLSWPHSPFKDFRLVQRREGAGEPRVWTITELLTSRALDLEGRAMRHCVATDASHLRRALRPPADLDLVDAGGERTGPAPRPDHRGRPAEADGPPGTEEAQPAATPGREGTPGAVGGGGRSVCRGVGESIGELRGVNADRSTSRHVGSSPLNASGHCVVTRNQMKLRPVAPHTSPFYPELARRPISTVRCVQAVAEAWPDLQIVQAALAQFSRYTIASCGKN